MVDFGISKGFRDFDRIEWDFIGISLGFMSFLWALTSSNLCEHV